MKRWDVGFWLTMGFCLVVAIWLFFVFVASLV